MSCDKNIRVEDLALCVSQDPVLVLELLKAANALYFSGGRPPITTATAAITRLGSDVVVKTLEELLERPLIEERDVKRLFEMHRNRCKRAAIIARLLAEVLAKTLQDDCHTSGLFLYLGEMLAALHLGMTYVKLHETNSPSGLIYRLSQEHRFDVEKMGLAYLQRQGVPDSVAFAVDRDGKTKLKERAIMKPICLASAELVDAFDTNRWEKLAPGKQLAPKSSLRLLQLSDAQYLRLYERASEYLFNEKMAAERISLEALSQPLDEGLDTTNILITTAEPTVSLPGDACNALEDEIQSLLGDTFDLDLPPSAPTRPPPTLPPPREGPAKLIEEKYSLGAGSQPKTRPRVEKAAPVVPPPPLRTAAGNTFVSNVTLRLDKAKTSEELLREILGILTDSGPFEKSALIVVSNDRKSALVVAARGPSITCGQTLVLDDPLSPLAQCFSKVQSFGNRSSGDSPWGSRAFALSPIDADHETPVALYADCGITGSLTFEARRIFRVVVDILNQKLPSVPGGIPVEV
jgi:HD-like signal output (HDOD) protein